jgi:hypothetical protein
VASLTDDSVRRLWQTPAEVGVAGGVLVN